MNQSEYIFEAIPTQEEIDINEIKPIEKSLRAGKGIFQQQAFQFLDWLTYNARVAVTSNMPGTFKASPFIGACAPTQSINTIILQKMGLEVNSFNMEDCVGDLPMSKEDRRRIQNGWRSTKIAHSVVLVKLPIYEEGKLQIKRYLLDPSFRQFCIKNNCHESLYWNKKRLQCGYVAPHPGYFLSAPYLKEQGKSQKEIEQAKIIAESLISAGYIELTEENAKIYGDAFAKAGIRQEFKDDTLKMTGKDYIHEFETRKREILPVKEYEEYTKTPLERKEKKKLIIRITEFFSRNNRKQLPEGIDGQGKQSKNHMEQYKVKEYKHPNVNQIQSRKENVMEIDREKFII